MRTPLKLVVDASALVAEVLRERGRDLFGSERLELYIASETWGEANHELPKRVYSVAGYHGLSDDAAEELLAESLRVVNRHIEIVHESLYANVKDVAQGRIPQDLNDWPSVALALTIDAGIWTEDRDFFGCGVATWRTPVLQHYVGTETA